MKAGVSDGVQTKPFSRGEKRGREGETFTKAKSEGLTSISPESSRATARSKRSQTKHGGWDRSETYFQQN